VIILIVDDDPHVREMIAHGLRHRGYRVALASHGPEALDCVQALWPELGAVVVDWCLPAASALALVEQVAAAPRPVPVPIVALATSDVESPPDGAVVTVVVQKPCRIPTVTRVVDRLLGGRGGSAPLGMAAGSPAPTPSKTPTRPGKRRHAA
jgi:CheY-like chemotaxis protein